MKEKYIFKNAAEEKEDFKKLYEKIENETIKARIKSSGEWYIEKASFYKKLFHVFSIISIIAPLFVTVATGMTCEWDKVKEITIVLSAAASLSTSLLTFLKCKDKWTLYRITIEMMKRELALYWADKCTDEADLKNLVEKLETNMEKEQQEWIEVLNKQGEVKKNQQDQSDDS